MQNSKRLDILSTKIDLIINNQNKLVNFQNEIENSGLNKALKSGEKIALPMWVC